MYVLTGDLVFRHALARATRNSSTYIQRNNVLNIFISAKFNQDHSFRILFTL